ncbi:hypothetical protein BDP81DRAFT_421535 [Colletotrichum phormii]|uniref:Uncharacterized protein n=1 Tax=Colletotrichum phormii TaxID=359342 RepID=A0AAJ0EK26_9PEZI|nr:uncharacterized protein BDP81DRAFT_421535 [Colletotrichum phormii]KAK1639626.1 hypothetical protein BDP81DRAFT_421535 [Colletotrichum phormii]
MQRATLFIAIGGMTLILSMNSHSFPFLGNTCLPLWLSLRTSVLKVALLVLRRVGSTPRTILRYNYYAAHGAGFNMVKNSFNDAMIYIIGILRSSVFHFARCRLARLGFNEVQCSGAGRCISPAM